MPNSLPPAASTRILAYHSGSGQPQLVTVEDQRVGGRSHAPLEGDGLPIVRETKAAGGMLRTFVRVNDKGEPVRGPDGAPRVELNALEASAQRGQPIGLRALFKRPLGNRTWLLGGLREKFLAGRNSPIVAHFPAEPGLIGGDDSLKMHPLHDDEIWMSQVVAHGPSLTVSEHGLDCFLFVPGNNAGAAQPMTVKLDAWRTRRVPTTLTSNASQSLLVDLILLASKDTLGGVQWRPTGDVVVHQGFISSLRREPSSDVVASHVEVFRPNEDGSWQQVDYFKVYAFDKEEEHSSITRSVTSSGELSRFIVSRPTKDPFILGHESPPGERQIIEMMRALEAAYPRESTPHYDWTHAGKARLYWGPLDSCGQPGGPGIVRPDSRNAQSAGWQWMGGYFSEGQPPDAICGVLNDGAMFRGRATPELDPEVGVAVYSDGPIRRRLGYFEQGQVTGLALVEAVDGSWKMSMHEHGVPHGLGVYGAPPADSAHELAPARLTLWSNGGILERAGPVYSVSGPESFFEDLLKKEEWAKVEQLVERWCILPVSWRRAVAALTNPQGETALHQAARAGAPMAVLTRLMHLGAKVNERVCAGEIEGATALSLVLGEDANFRSSLRAFCRDDSAGILLDTIFSSPDEVVVSASYRHTQGIQRQGGAPESLRQRVELLVEAGASYRLCRDLRIVANPRRSAGTDKIGLSVRMLAIWRDDLSLLKTLMPPPACVRHSHHRRMRSIFRLGCETAYAAWLGRADALRLCREQLVSRMGHGF